MGLYWVIGVLRTSVCYSPPNVDWVYYNNIPIYPIFYLLKGDSNRTCSETFCCCRNWQPGSGDARGNHNLAATEYSTHITYYSSFHSLSHYPKYIGIMEKKMDTTT